MKIIGLFVVVFSGLLITRALGFSEMDRMTGVLIGVGVYILIQINDD